MHLLWSGGVLLKSGILLLGSLCSLSCFAFTNADFSGIDGLDLLLSSHLENIAHCIKKKMYQKQKGHWMLIVNQSYNK